MILNGALPHPPPKGYDPFGIPLFISGIYVSRSDLRFAERAAFVSLYNANTQSNLPAFAAHDHSQILPVLYPFLQFLRS